MNSNSSSPSSSFFFGPAVAFTGEPNPAAADSLAEVRRLAHEDRRKLEADLADARARLSVALGQVTVAQTAKETAERAEHVARRVFNSTRTPGMDDYERAVDLQQRFDAQERNLKDTRELYSAASQRATDSAADVAFRDRQLADLQAEKDTAKAALAATKQELADQKQAVAETDEHLNNAYADLEQERAATKALRKARDDAEATAKERELEIEDLHEELRLKQETIDTLDDNSVKIDDLMHNQEHLETEIEDLRTQLSEHDRTVQVKDARIAHLETQYQKALEGKLNAEAAVTASAAPTDTPHVFTSGDASLQDELDAASDYSDDATSFQQLDFSDIIEIADIAPAAPTLSIGTVQGTSIAPVAQQSATSSTQTDTPELSYDVVHSVTADISPVEPTEASNSVVSTQTDDVVILAERKSQTAAAQTVISNPPLRKTADGTTFSLRPMFAERERSDVDTQTAPIVEKTPEPTIIRVIASDQKKGRFSARTLAIISALALFISLYLFAELEAYKNANGYGYGSRNRYSTGAFGHGRYLFGVIPIGFDIGHDWFSEQVCRTTSTAVATFEDWIGITPTPLY